ncbi:MAG TPA: hypothetical protein PL135_05760 [Spirochaetota bacterium]|nr:hypothetical protein [Spirochaetota bacterium]
MRRLARVMAPFEDDFASRQKPVDALLFPEKHKGGVRQAVIINKANRQQCFPDVVTRVFRTVLFLRPSFSEVVDRRFVNVGNRKARHDFR